MADQACGCLAARGESEDSPHILTAPDFVIPSAARDLHFRGELQIPRFARDDNS